MLLHDHVLLGRMSCEAGRVRTMCLPGQFLPLCACACVSCPPDLCSWD